MSEKDTTNQHASGEELSINMDEKKRKIIQVAKLLDVYSENASPKELLGRVLVELGDEDDDELTFFEQVDKMEHILYEIGDLPQD
ncbi:MAG TPA: hypothetical protein PLG47_01800 [Candidatus Dojkabacteria bacterium]|nr:hypothetical protein [Candidatus Dojkabacteria bacterium]